MEMPDIVEVFVTSIRKKLEKAKKSYSTSWKFY